MIHNPEADFPQARSFVGNVLKDYGFNGNIIAEVMLMLEALWFQLREQYSGRDYSVKVAVKRVLGSLHIELGFEGPMFIPAEVGSADVSPEAKITEAYADKIDYRYRAGYNTISISVLRRQQITFMALALLLALLVYIPVNQLFPVDSVKTKALLDDYLYPVQNLFVNAISLVAAPVTFFSLLKNMSDTYIISGRHSVNKRIKNITYISSALAVLLAILAAFLVIPLTGHLDFLSGNTYSPVPFKEILSELVPSNFIQAFLSSSPFPLIFTATLMTYALCSAGKFFDMFKTVVDALYSLLSRMLSIIMAALPAFFFMAMLILFISKGFSVIPKMIFLMLIVVLASSFLLVAYAIRLAISGMDLKGFIRSLPPLIKENIDINSAIDAVPFNVRFCAKHFHISRKTLTGSLRLLAQINLDGNCFVLTYLALLFMFHADLPISPLNIIGTGLLVLFLSFGAPNQPGSCLIGGIIILSYLNIPEAATLAICAEVCFGGIINIMNVLGDIVAVVADDSIRKKQRSA